jgi:hypothetical protein
MKKLLIGIVLAASAAACRSTQSEVRASNECTDPNCTMSAEECAAMMASGECQMKAGACETKAAECQGKTECAGEAKVCPVTGQTQP